MNKPHRKISSDRIPCIVAGCRRTAPADKYPSCKEIICGKCWKLVPKALKDRHKSLNKRERQLKRLWAKRGVDNPNLDALYREHGRNWASIRASFSNEQPKGLQSFIELIGVGR